MKADLHCHSYFSDGQHPPQFLMDRAVANHLTHLAITDHDCLLNCSELKIPPGLTLVPGLEISAGWRGMEIHIVGLGIDAESTPLNDYVCRQQQLRRDRIVAMDKKLSGQNISGLLEYLQSRPCISWTRSHVAEFLVAEGHAKDMHRAFKRFLRPGGSAFVAAQWPEMDEAIAAIQQASGIAVLAHPGRYGLTRSKLSRLMDDFQHSGGDAAEVSYGSINPVQQSTLTTMVQERGLYASAGSDFHSADRQWTDIGKFPGLGSAATKNAIWAHPRWHFD
ncbi:MAG: PHP domain-containing protein [Pseudomonadota bacterium]|nr:PHP domain-containing protein [Pseudomonadota bacterium]